MSISRATYCTREDVLSALGLSASPRQYPKIDRAIESATASIDGRCHRTFHPTTATRSFTWPDPSSLARSWVLWLDDNELCNVTAISSGGVPILPAGVLLEPQKTGPPYSRIEIDQASSYGWSSGTSGQRAITITSTAFGYTDRVEPGPALTANVTAGATTVTVTGPGVGVGDLVTVDAERMIVTGRAWADTGKTITATAPATAGATGQVLAVAAGSDWTEGETLLVDAEQVEILAVVGNTLIVERAVNSTTLAAHTTGTALWAPRTLRVTRAANGTTATAHGSAVTMYRAIVPGPIRSLAVGEALVELQQLSAGYARTAGSGDNERVIGAGAGLGDLRDQVETKYRRKVRIRVI